MIDKSVMKSAFESMLFVWGEPLAIKDAAEVFGIDPEEANDIFDELMIEYEESNRGIRLRKINDSYQLVTPEENAEFVRRLCTPVKVKRLSQAALEVLAIIAYKQPVTKGEIDAIRGIKCDRVVEGLQDKGLIEVKGRSNAVGRPLLYGTTDLLLQQFGFSSIDELPDIDNLEGVMGVDAETEDAEMDYMQLKLNMEV